MSLDAFDPATLDKPLVLLLPVFNDWMALRKLLVILDAVSSAHGLTMEVLIVDDGSTAPAEPGFSEQGFASFECIQILRLRRNLGHQRAVATGLLTSRQVRVGNFSVIPAARLASLVVVSEMWNHYAAAVYKSRQPLALVPTQRGQRLEGKSKMNFTNLVIHGLSAISVYGDTIGVRLLVATTLFIGLAVAGLVGVAAIRLLTDWSIPEWITAAAGTLLIVLFQAIMFSFIFSFIILGDRQGSTFLPLRDYRYFVGSVKTVYQKQ
jgi:hypothetical protein